MTNWNKVITFKEKIHSWPERRGSARGSFIYSAISTIYGKTSNGRCGRKEGLNPRGALTYYFIPLAHLFTASYVLRALRESPAVIHLPAAGREWGLSKNKRKNPLECVIITKTWSLNSEQGWNTWEGQFNFPLSHIQLTIHMSLVAHPWLHIPELLPKWNVSKMFSAIFDPSYVFKKNNIFTTGRKSGKSIFPKLNKMTGLRNSENSNPEQQCWVYRYLSKGVEY